MKFQMHENSLFALLLRSSWWTSAAIALGIFAAVRIALPEGYQQYGFFAALPFMAISGYAGWRQLRTPGDAAVGDRLEAIRTLTWTDFSTAIEEAFRRDGHTVVVSGTPGADFELAKAGRVSLLGCKRWKVARTGVEPLRELDAARRKRDAQESIYIAAGEISDTARAFATEKGIRLIHGAELARLLPKPRGMQKS